MMQLCIPQKMYDAIFFIFYQMIPVCGHRRVCATTSHRLSPNLHLQKHSGIIHLFLPGGPRGRPHQGRV